MLSYRSYLLETFGIDHIDSIVSADTIKIHKNKDCEPIAESVTNDKGRTVLRVGQVKRLN